MTIETGQLAPPFTAETWRDGPFDLEAYRGEKLWLGFYRWASCPLCSLRLHEVIQRYDDIRRAGVRHVAVFQSPADRIELGVGTQDPPFPIIPDPELEHYEAYGVHARFAAMFYPRVMLRAMRSIAEGFFSLRMDGPKAMVPADFLIDPEGLVWRAYYGDAISDHVPFEVVEEFAADLCLDMPESAASPAP